MNLNEIYFLGEKKDKYRTKYILWADIPFTNYLLNSSLRNGCHTANVFLFSLSANVSDFYGQV
jgi:hypothetical protein